MRLIDVSVLKEWVENWFTKNRLYHPYAKNNTIPITELYDILEQMPTVEDLSGFCDKLWRAAYERGKEEGKAERGTGKWIRSRRPRSYERWCSECGEKSWYCGTGDYTFCPHCGAEMETEGEEG